MSTRVLAKGDERSPPTSPWSSVNGISSDQPRDGHDNGTGLHDDAQTGSAEDESLSRICTLPLHRRVDAMVSSAPRKESASENSTNRHARLVVMGTDGQTSHDPDDCGTSCQQYQSPFPNTDSKSSTASILFEPRRSQEHHNNCNTTNSVDDPNATNDFSDIHSHPQQQQQHQQQQADSSTVEELIEASSSPPVVDVSGTILFPSATFSREAELPRFSSGIDPFALTSTGDPLEPPSFLIHEPVYNPSEEEEKREIEPPVITDSTAFAIDPQIEPTTTFTTTTTNSAEDLSRLNMGYSNNQQHPSTASWGVSSADNETNGGDSRTDKMEETTDQTASERTSNTTERKDRDDDDTTILSMESGAVVVGSPATTPLHAGHVPPEAEEAAGQGSVLGTPSTVSTALSTEADEASVALDTNALERLAMKMEPGAFAGVGVGVGEPSSAPYQNHNHGHSHNRDPSWEELPHQATAQFLLPPEQQRHEHVGYGTHALPPAFAPQPGPAPSPAAASVWGNIPIQHQRVASFREPDAAEHVNRYAAAYPPMGAPPADNRWQQALQHQPQQPPQHQPQPPHQQQQRFHGEPQLPFVARGSAPVDGRVYRHPQQAYNSFPSRRPAGAYAQPPLAPSATPPRASRGQRPPGQSPHRQGPPGSGTGPGHPHSGHTGHSVANSRSSSEILKTLLRKKACLYEPDTSRAVALVTWLVGRELALTYGFFSRQQLQAGVHACVADKIESGAITRTKVNRCMQIILNSCFHYIIPRPDGTEENGDCFRASFAAEVKDDTFLLRVLPAPWNDLVVNRADILSASSAEPADSKAGGKSSTPQSSPRLGSVPVDKGSPGNRDGCDGDSGEGKRAVLLCFNENVRCAEDVFRCHNEFIGDTAHTSNLQLSSQEWRQFFGKDAAGAPYLWGNVGIPVPYADGHNLSIRSGDDALGMMTASELAKFRTSWCAKRYDHDHELCGFAHVKVNGGWLRRNPAVYKYSDKLCPAISKLVAADGKQRGGGAVSNNGGGGSKVFVVNECPRGVHCEFAHSEEEVVYHPRRYKSRSCACLSRPGGCPLSDVCPDFHPSDRYRFSSSKKQDHHHHRGGGTGQQRHPRLPGGGGKAPSGAPVLYASPAPVSSFEHHLHMPGLKNLYRRQCAVVRAHLGGGGCGAAFCRYSYFGDDAGIAVSNGGVEATASGSGIRQGLAA